MLQLAKIRNPENAPIFYYVHHIVLVKICKIIV